MLVVERRFAHRKGLGREGVADTSGLHLRLAAAAGKRDDRYEHRSQERRRAGQVPRVHTELLRRRTKYAMTQTTGGDFRPCQLLGEAFSHLAFVDRECRQDLVLLPFGHLEVDGFWKLPTVFTSDHRRRARPRSRSGRTRLCARRLTPHGRGVHRWPPGPSHANAPSDGRTWDRSMNVRGREPR